MRTSCLPLLWLAALLALAGCSAAPAGQSGAASHRPTSTMPVSSPASTGAATPTTARCPQLPAAQPGQPPAAPLSLYVSRFSNADNSVSLAALNPSDGAARWQATINQDGYALTSVAVANNVVYVITAAGAISALNASDGRLRWCVLAGDQVISAPNNATGGAPQLVINQGLLYAAGGCRGTLLALDADGTQRWQAKTDDCVTLLTAANGQLYAGTAAAGGAVCALAAYRASDGQKAWCFQPTNNLSSAPVLADGVAYASEAGPKDGAGFLDTLDVSDGSVRSRAQLSQDANLSRLTVVDGIAYGTLSTTDTCSVAALTAASGAARWQIPRCAEIGPTVANNVLFFGWVNGTPTDVQPTISALSADTGQQLWQTSLPHTQSSLMASLQLKPASPRTSGPVFNALTVFNDVVYVGYLANTPGGTRSFVVPLNAHTGQPGWRAEGVLLAVG